MRLKLAAWLCGELFSMLPPACGRRIRLAHGGPYASVGALLPRKGPSPGERGTVTRADHQRLLRALRVLRGLDGPARPDGRASEARATGQRPGEWGMIGRHLRVAPGLRAVAPGRPEHQAPLAGRASDRTARHLWQAEPRRRASTPTTGCRIGRRTDAG
ncbi:hypothetical protein AMK32_29185 [Streptomyces sp. CB01883]|nr:hypothetical protein AMK32_29185 [Streptomyces sp. CB01883]